MAIMFHNVKTGERRLCKTEPMIAAHYNTSDRNPNAHQGQDMGWRLSPATVIELERILATPAEMQTIATTFGIPTDDVTQTDVLNWISRQSDRKKQGAEDKPKDFEREYQDDIRRLRDEQDRRDASIAQEARSKGETVPKRILDQEKANGSQPTKPEGDSIEEGLTPPVDLSTLKRPELEEYADGIGIENPKEFKNVTELINAIKAKEAEEA